MKNCRSCDYFQRWPLSIPYPSVCTPQLSHWGSPLPLNLGWHHDCFDQENGSKVMFWKCVEQLKITEIFYLFFLGTSTPRMFLLKGSYHWRGATCSCAEASCRGLRSADSHTNTQSWKSVFLDITAQLNLQVTADLTKFIWDRIMNTHLNLPNPLSWRNNNRAVLKALYSVCLHGNTTTEPRPLKMINQHCEHINVQHCNPTFAFHICFLS
jgi:hypothetical protein